MILDDELLREAGRAGAGAERGRAWPPRIWRFDEVFALADEAVEAERSKALHARVQPDTVASLIFTSGTTGKPKGVMLTHRNFTFMVSELSRVFDFGVTDGMLSVLPLHHTFEFSAGLLMPLARGAQITYLRELTGEAINGALKKGHVTAIVGVPALWELLKRRMMQKLTDQSPLLEPLVKALAAGNYELRAEDRARPGHAAVLPGARRVRRAHPLPDQRRLGAAARRDEDLPGHGLQLLRGLRPDRDRAGADRHPARQPAAPRLGGQAAAGHGGQDRQPRRPRAWAR